MGLNCSCPTPYSYPHRGLEDGTTEYHSAIFRENVQASSTLSPATSLTSSRSSEGTTKSKSTSPLITATAKGQGGEREKDRDKKSSSGASATVPSTEARVISLTESLPPISSQDEPECVMCLDTFDAENPVVPTLCSCGVNRALFHLSCLYEWLQYSPNCPVCRQVLFFEEVN